MQEKILYAIDEIEKSYLNGNYTGEEYHSLLHELNSVSWLISKFNLANVNSSTIQQVVHRKQELI